MLLAQVSAAIVVLYLLRLQRKRVQVPFARLWNRVAAATPASRLFRALRRILSLLIQLTIAALIALALGRPELAEDGAASGRFGCSEPSPPAPPEPRHTLLVVDVSASMDVVDVPGGRLSQAIDRAAAVVRSRRDGEKVALATLCSQLDLLSPFSADSDALLTTLATRVRTQDCRADFGVAREAFRSTLAGLSQPRVVLVSDGNVELPPASAELPFAVEWIFVGNPTPPPVNLSLEAFEVRPYLDDPLTYELAYRVRNHSDVEVRASLVLYAGQGSTPEALLEQGRAVETFDLVLPARGVAEDFIANVEIPESRILGRVVVRGDSGLVDAMPRDDSALATIPPRRKLRVQLVSEGNLYLEAALFVREHVQYTWIKPSAYAGPEGFDMTILDRWVPAQWAEGAYLVIAPPAERSPVPVVGEVMSPELAKPETKHPLLWKVALADFNVAKMAKLAPAPRDTVIATAASGEPAIVVHEEGGAKMVLWAFDIGATDLPLRYAFPVLLVNTLNWFYGEDSSLRLGKRAGSDWAVPVGLLPATVTEVEQPSGAVVKAPVVEQRALVRGERAGFYGVATAAGPLWLAASLREPAESALTAPARGERQYEPPPPPPPKEAAARLPLPLWKLVLLAAVALLMVEWFTYQRRITV
jgi:hypothetical protein